MVARVIGKSPTRWQAWIQIDKGSADGVQVDQPVVGATPVAGETLAGKGLVGKVIAVTAHTAKVQLITDSESSVAAKIQGSRAEGIVEGSVSGRLIMDYVDRDITVDPKLVIVTSGFGGIYPPDIPIGIVANVGEEDVNIYKEIEVQPFVDFRVLEEVMVLIVPETTVDPRRRYDSPRATRHLRGPPRPQLDDRPRPRRSRTSPSPRPVRRLSTTTTERGRRGPQAAESVGKVAPVLSSPCAADAAVARSACSGSRPTSSSSSPSSSRSAEGRWRAPSSASSPVSSPTSPTMQPLGVRSLIYVLAGYFVGMFVPRFGTVSPWAVFLLAGGDLVPRPVRVRALPVRHGPAGGLLHHDRHADAARGRPRRL